MHQGWVGNWSPGIGDPTIGGWVTVVLYALAAWACHRVLHLERQRQIILSANERLTWRLLMLAMIALGINKQLDLQSALTEWERILAFEQGWYGNRRQYQVAFIAAVPVAGLTVLAAMLVLIWGSPAPTLWACTGAAGLVVFVAIRAASFHHVDEILGWRLGGLPLNWILEMGSLVVIAWGAFRRAQVQA
ncbi:MAG: hypothetical protein QM740_02020 [Acidovorax sp.]